MKLEVISIKKIKPYKQIRKWEKSISLLMDSIKDFGFINTILITEDYEVISGNIRLIAAEKCGLKEIPCIIIDSLNQDQIKAYRLIDNQVGEFTIWDYTKKKEEIKTIKMNLFKYGLPEYYLTDINIDDFFEKTGFEQVSLFEEDIL